ncbi:zinc finger and BTB domain-containing protein 24-like [Ylistrum balloti]|uniref:zinc finger and BTB domain-containing protein 24-like n=1 Tax=Ylistrum balloti TaxID=509963 RepID=UPI00290581E6|nr:zinc finger and BTB domain-containing protein 24-like [Ylistrum balloti]
MTTELPANTMSLQQQQQQQPSLDLSSYMDIVTTYKCRFCTFTSTVPQTIGLHIRQVHVAQGEFMAQETNNDSAEVKDTKNTENKITTTSIYQDSNVNGVQDVSEQTANNQITQVMTNFVDMETSAVSVLPLSMETTTADAILQLSTRLPDSNGDVDDGSLSEKSNSNDDNTNITHFVTVHEEDQDEESFTADPTIIQQSFQQVHSNRQPVMTTGESQTAIQEPSMESESLILTDASQQKSAPVTRELFLCGQCSIGFNSIDECRAHMMDDHADMRVEEDNELSHRVSVGTQVETTKRGRKRKTVTVKSESPPYALDSDPDLDWDDQEEYKPRGSRSRRKIRPPRALKEDYYLGKSKVKEKPKVMQGFKLKCDEIGCCAKFRTKEALEVHLKCHMTDVFEFKCPECDKSNETWKQIRIHLWKVHEIDTDLLTCDICGKFKTDTMSRLLIHKEIHSVDRPYTCDICGKGFRQFSQMKNHQTIHGEHQEDDPSKWYHRKECHICKRQYANQKCLIKHIEAVHSKIKPYVCPYCGHTAARKAMMELHIRTHTGEKPFKCDNCQYVTGDHNSLRRHKMRHSGQKPYKCQFCGYSCIQAISIKMHMKNKHPGGNIGVFCCDICTFRTVNEVSFKGHMEDHKNGLIVENAPPVPQQQPRPHIIIQQPAISSQFQQGDKMEKVTVQGATSMKFGETINFQSLGQIEGQTIEEHVVEVPMDKMEDNQLQMQIQTLESGETQISEEDLTRLSSYEGLVPSDLSAAQLVLSALNAISSQNSERTNNETPQILNGVETSIMSSDIKDGVTTHTITFHMPASAAENVVGATETITDAMVADNVVDMTESIGSLKGVEDTTSVQNGMLILSGQPVTLNPVIMNSDQTSSATIQDLAQVSCLMVNQ